MKALIRILSLICVLCLFIGFSSCRSTRHSPGPKEYIEKNGLHSSKKPHELAKEFGNKGKKEKKAYKKQLRRAAKDMKRRNKLKVKGGYYEKK